jgi:hypothetical protein
MAITNSELEFIFIWILFGAFASLIINSLTSAVSPQTSLVVGLTGVLAIAAIFRLK